MITEKQFSKNYWELDQLLSAYIGLDADFDQFDIEVTLERYINTSPLEKRYKALAQAKEVLMLHHFPEENIKDLIYPLHLTMAPRELLEYIVEILERKLKEHEMLQKQSS